jgi:hypothetical protein
LNKIIIGIIVLFIGVGIQPAFANEVSITAISNNKEDCNCKPVSNLHLVVLERLSNRLDRLLDRLEVYTGVISILYRHKPDFTEKFNEFSNEIITLRESNNDLKSIFEFGIHEEICNALMSTINSLHAYYNYLDLLMEENPQLIPILYPIRVTIDIVMIQLAIIYTVILCMYEPPPLTY